MSVCKHFLLFLLGLCLFAMVNSADETLVLLDNIAMKHTYSIFFKSLIDRGFRLHFSALDDSNVNLIKYKENLYDHLIIFSHLTETFDGSLNPEEVTKFIDAGGNVFVGMDSFSDSSVQELSNECGMDIEEDSFVIDHLNFDVRDQGNHTLIVVDPSDLIEEPCIVGSRNISPVLFSGIGVIKHLDSPLIIDVLKANPMAYMCNIHGNTAEYPITFGKDVLLISALQAENNARVLFIGSLEFFSNQFMVSKVQKFYEDKYYEKSGNLDLSTALSNWTFKRTGILRIGKVTHHRRGESNFSNSYTVMDDVIYSIEIETLKEGKWVIYESNDLQVEFSRTETYVRVPLQRKGNMYVAEFKLPDVWGVYLFEVDYHRKGYTYIYSAVQVSVRPFQHSQHERFIHSAYPYYLSSFSMMIGVISFSFLFLYSSEKIKFKSE